MKKLCLFLALVILSINSLIMSSCALLQNDNFKETDTESGAIDSEDETYAVPEGYQQYSNQFIRLAYPNEWTKTNPTPEIVLFSDSSDQSSNITVSRETVSDFYASMTTESFGKQIKPLLRAQGMLVMGEEVAQVKNKNGVTMTKITYLAEVSKVMFEQTIYVIPVKKFNYFITLTEEDKSEALDSAVFDSIALVEKTNKPG